MANLLLFLFMLSAAHAADTNTDIPTISPSQPGSPAAQDGPSCRKKYTPETILDELAAKNTQISVDFLTLRDYFDCRALGLKDPNACQQLNVFPMDAVSGNAKKGSGNEDCLRNFHFIASLLEVISGKGDGSKECKAANAGLSGSDQSCPNVKEQYLHGSARSVCAGLPKQYFKEDGACERQLVFLDADPNKCRPNGKQNSPEYCKTSAGLIKMLRTKDAASCRATPMCRAALTASPEHCQFYAQKVTAAYCQSYVASLGKKKKSAPEKYSPEQMDILKNAQAEKLQRDLKKVESERKARQREQEAEEQELLKKAEEAKKAKEAN